MTRPTRDAFADLMRRADLEQDQELTDRITEAHEAGELVTHHQDYDYQCELGFWHRGPCPTGDERYDGPVGWDTQLVDLDPEED